MPGGGGQATAAPGDGGGAPDGPRGGRPAGAAASPPGAFEVRLVVAGLDGGGSGAFLRDGQAPGAVGLATGPGACTVLWSDHWPLTPQDDGGALPGPLVLEPPPGGVCTRVIRLPPPPPGSEVDDQWLRMPGDDPSWPGRHTTDTLDLMVVLDGAIVLGLDEGEHTLGPGDAVVQRGTPHRWRVVGDRPCTYAVTLLRPSRPEAADGSGEAALEAGPPVAGSPGEATGRSRAERTRPGGHAAACRIVSGMDLAGRSYAVSSGPAPVVAPLGGAGPTVTDLWRTGGPVTSVDQGGDLRGLQPDVAAGDGRHDGVTFRMVEWFGPHGGPSDCWPAGAPAGTATATVDVAVVVTGHARLELAGGASTVLRAGDVAVCRGLGHQWSPTPGEDVRLATVTVATG